MIRTILLAATLSLAAPAWAQTAQSAPSADTLAAARELMAQSDIQGQMRTMAPRMADTMAVQIRQMFADSKVPEGLNVELIAATQAYIASMDTVFTPALGDQLAGVYARHFSAAELRHLSALMKDPVMARFKAEMPNVMADMMPLIFAAMKPHQDQFMQKVRKIVADWVARHPEDKAKLRSPAAS